MSGKKILVVEDSEIQAKILIRWLSKHGYNVLWAKNLSECRAIVSSEPLDVVLMDWELPDGNGIDLISDIFSYSSLHWLPIIMVTSHTEPERMKEAFEAGAIDFIRKPAEKIELLARVFGALRIKDLQDRLRETSIRDVLTNLYNRRYLDERIVQEFQRCKRHKRPLSIALLDIDFFKKVNDEYGHDVGDLVLKNLATVIKARLRTSDILARYGGEEFVILLPETAIENALMVLEKIRKLISELPIKTEDGRPLLISFSAGLSGGDLADVTSPFDLLKLADKYLYQAKNKGRNRVIAQVT